MIGEKTKKEQTNQIQELSEIKWKTLTKNLHLILYFKILTAFFSVVWKINNLDHIFCTCQFGKIIAILS